MACCPAGSERPFDAGTLSLQWMGGGRPSTCHSNSISFTPLLCHFDILDNVIRIGETLKAEIAQSRDITIMFCKAMCKHTVCLNSSFVHVRMIIEFPANT